MSTMKVQLVNPPPFKVIEPWYDTPNFPRMSLSYLGGYLREKGVARVDLLDAKLERLSFDETLARTNSFSPRVVGLTAMTNEIKPAARLAKMIKEALPNTITVIGGVHVSALPEETLREFEAFDIGVIGEGEITLVELCEAIQKGSALREVPGLVIRDLGEPRLTQIRDRAKDLDSISFPAWDLMPRAEMYMVMTSRGCPFHCHFCMNASGRLLRPRSIDKVLNEMRLLVLEYGVKEMQIADETFSANRDRTIALLNRMIDEGISEKTAWFVMTHVRFLDYELCALMKRANIKLVGVGIETGDEEILKTLGKGTNRKLIFQAREAAQRAGLPIVTYFILGQPNETRQSMLRTIELAVELNAEVSVFGIMVPYPGTEVGRMAALGEGKYRLMSMDWDDYNKQVGGALEFTNMRRSEMELMQIRAYLEVYLRNGRYVDVGKFIWQYRTAGWAVVKKLFRRRKTKVEPESAARVEIDSRIMIKAAETWKTRHRTQTQHTVSERAK